MVALKHGSSAQTERMLVKKQERRGGIETGDRKLRPQSEEAGSRNAVVALKPRCGPIWRIGWGNEAGTPWWH